MNPIDRISLTVLGLAAIGAVTYLVSSVDPDAIRQWGLVLAPVLPGLVLLYQNYRTDKNRKDQIEVVHQAVNSQTKRELDAKGVTEYIRGQAEMLSTLRPLIVEAVAEERLAAAVVTKAVDDGGNSKPGGSDGSDAGTRPV